MIHGYGSSGKGGALCVGPWKSFGLKKKGRVITEFIVVRTFRSSTTRCWPLLEAVPELRGDPDLGATNEGVTVLWLK